VSDSNGKGIPGKKSWRARFEGLWSVAEEKWLQKRVTPRSAETIAILIWLSSAPLFDRP
jgi:hypothetical protein